MINYLVIGLYMQDYFPSTPQALWVILAVVLVTGLNILGIRLLAGMNLVVRAPRSSSSSPSSRRWRSARSPATSTCSPSRRRSTTRARTSGWCSPAPRSSRCRSSASTPSRRCRRRRRTRGARSRCAIMLCALVGGAVYIFQSYLGHLAFPDFESFADQPGRRQRRRDEVRSASDFLNTFFTAAYVAGVLRLRDGQPGERLADPLRDGPRRQPAEAGLRPAAPRYRTPVVANVVVGVFGLTALFISLATVSSMISFGALAAFSFVNLSVIKTYVIDGGGAQARPRQVRGDPVPRLRVHDLPVDAAERR